MVHLSPSHAIVIGKIRKMILQPSISSLYSSAKQTSLWEIPLSGFQVVQHQLPVDLQDAIYRWGGERIRKALGNANLTWQGFEKKSFTKIEAHAGME